MISVVTTRRSQRTAVLRSTAADTLPTRTTRSRRTAPDPLAKATVSRGHQAASSLSPESMRLTVKAPASKLREATRSSSSGGREHFVGGEIIEGKRARNVKKSYVLESDSEDEDEDEEMEDVVDDDDVEGESSEEEDEDEDADADADGDVDMDAPPPPVIKVSKARSGKQTIVARPPPKADTVTVQHTEVQLVSDDEELSELESEVAEEEAMQTGNEEDAEEEEEEEEEGEEIEVEADEEEEELDSDDDIGLGGSRASTPDLNKLTKRQRARLEEGDTGHLLALPDGKFIHTFHLTRIALTPCRGSSQEASDGRGARHETCRDGPPQEEPEREAQRGGKGTPVPALTVLR
jgi:Ino eighty subunit 2